MRGNPLFLTCNRPLVFHAKHQVYNMSHASHATIHLATLHYMRNATCLTCTMDTCLYKSDFTNHNIEFGSSYKPIPFIIFGLNHNLRSYLEFI